MEDKCGVGCQLARLIPGWAVQFKKGCGCKDMAKKMDAWGKAGCERHRSYIVSHLVGQSDMLIPVFKVVPKNLRKVAAERLLSAAIKRA